MMNSYACTSILLISQNEYALQVKVYNQKLIQESGDR